MFVRSILQQGTLGLLAAVCTAVLPSAAQATNLEYDLTGLAAIAFHQQGAPAGTGFRLVWGNVPLPNNGGFTPSDRPNVNYSFSLDDATGSATLSGTIDNGRISTLQDHNAYLSDDLFSATFTINYTGLDVGTDPVTGLPLDSAGNSQSPGAIGRNASGTGHIEITSEFLGGSVVVEFNVEDKYMFPTAPQPGEANYERYHPFSTAPFNLILADLLYTDITDDEHYFDYFAAWFMGLHSVKIFGVSYNVTGDFDATTSLRTEVPEPATMALLGMGLLAGAVRRRRDS